MLKGELKEKKGIDYMLICGSSSGWIKRLQQQFPSRKGLPQEHLVPAPSPDPGLTVPSGLRRNISTLRVYYRCSLGSYVVNTHCY